MSFLLHFDAGTYTNLRADLISRNKIDSVSFDLKKQIILTNKGK